MKNPLIPSAILILCVIACKSPNASLKGYYSFKSGGYLEIEAADTAFTRNIVPESGQMHVLDNGNDKFKVTMNITGGNPVVFDATAKDGTLTLLPTKRKVYVFPDDEATGQSISLLFEVCGTGKRYENQLIMEMKYTGEYPFGNEVGEIAASHVNCIATENE